MKRTLAIIAVLLLAGCTDADRSRISSYGDAGEITCYSGGEKIYSGKSTGKIQANNYLPGFEFREAGTDRFIRTNADCVVSN